MLVASDELRSLVVLGSDIIDMTRRCYLWTFGGMLLSVLSFIA